MEFRTPESSPPTRRRKGAGALWRCLGMERLRAGMAPVAAGGVGKRDPESAKGLLQRLQAVRCGDIPCLPSEQWPHYPQALLQVYGIPEVILHMPGKRGPKPPPQRLAPPALHEAQGGKRRQGGRGVHVTPKSICGSAEAGPRRFATAAGRQTSPTSFVERNPWTGRQGQGCLARKVRRVSQDLPW